MENNTTVPNGPAMLFSAKIHAGQCDGYRNFTLHPTFTIIIGKNDMTTHTGCHDSFARRVDIIEQMLWRKRSWPGWGFDDICKRKHRGRGQCHG